MVPHKLPPRAFCSLLSLSLVNVLACGGNTGLPPLAWERLCSAGRARSLGDTASGEEVTRLGSGVASYWALVTDIDLGSGRRDGDCTAGKGARTGARSRLHRRRRRRCVASAGRTQTTFWFGSRLP